MMSATTTTSTTHHRFTSYLLIVLCVSSIHTLPNGAPETTCYSLLPFHGGGSISPLQSQSLFSIKPQNTAVGQGQILRIEIQGSIQHLSFKGFMIHARTLNGKIVGKFAASADGLVKLINCDGNENTATHSNTNPKVDFGLDWQAPSDYLGEVIFK